MKRNVTGTILLLVFALFVSCLERTDLIVDETATIDSLPEPEETAGIIPRDTLIRQGGWNKINPMGPFDGLFLQFKSETLRTTAPGFGNTTTYRSWRIVEDTLEAFLASASPFRSLCYRISYAPVAPGADTGCPSSEKVCRPDTLYAVECGEEDSVAFVYEWQDNG